VRFCRFPIAGGREVSSFESNVLLQELSLAATEFAAWLLGIPTNAAKQCTHATSRFESPTNEAGSCLSRLCDSSLNRYAAMSRCTGSQPTWKRPQQSEKGICQLTTTQFRRGYRNPEEARTVDYTTCPCEKMMWRLLSPSDRRREVVLLCL